MHPFMRKWRYYKIISLFIFLFILMSLFNAYEERKRDKLFSIYPNFFIGKNRDDLRISLIIHLSFREKIKEKLRKHIENWEAPIVFVILTQKEKEETTRNELQTFTLSLSQEHNSLLQIHLVVNGYNYKSEREKKAKYPSNMLRNIGRKYLRTRYCVISDLDIFFSSDFEKRMLATMTDNRKDNKAVYIYRLFEVELTESEHHNPINIFNLRDKYSNGRAVPFHKRLYPNLPTIKGIEEWWERGNQNRNGAQRINKIPFPNFHWEPQFASEKSIPLHDERFPYGIKDNTVLRWQLCSSNYSFYVVDNLFGYHLGIESSEKYEIERKAIQLHNKRQFMRAFEEFKEDYDKTNNSNCPLLTIGAVLK